SGVLVSSSGTGSRAARCSIVPGRSIFCGGGGFATLGGADNAIVFSSSISSIWRKPRSVLSLPAGFTGSGIAKSLSGMGQSFSLIATMLVSSPASICSVYWPIVPLQVFAVKSYTIEDQGFANVAARADCSRHRRSQGEEGAGGGLCPPPAPSSPQRLASEPFRMKRPLLRSPARNTIFSCYFLL